MRIISTRPTPPDHAGCRGWVREQFGAMDCDVTVSTAAPLVVTAYDQTPFVCPHGTVFHIAPTSEQIAAWTRDGVT